MAFQKSAWFKGTGSPQLVWGVAAIAAGVWACMGWLFIKGNEHEMRDDFFQQARLAAQGIDMKDIQALSGDETDRDAVSYRRIQKQLAGVRSMGPQRRYLSLLGRRGDGTVCLFLDSEPAGSKHDSPLGRNSDKTAKEIIRVFDAETPTVIGRRGNWITALVPIPRDGGDTAAVLGMSVNAADWFREVASRSALPVGLTCLLFAGMVMVVAASVRSRKALLRDSEDRFRLITETITEVFWISDISPNNIFYVSPAFELIWGRTPESLYENPKSFMEAIHPEDKDYFLAALEAKKDDLPFEREYRIIRPDDGVRWIWEQGFPIRDDSGHVHRYVGISQDITARKTAEKALAESEALYRNMCENAPLGMHFYRLDSRGRLVFTHANPAADKILKMDHSLFVGKTIEEVFPPLKETEVPARYREAAEKGVSWTREQINYQDDRIDGAFEVVAFQTAPENMVAVFADITRRKQAEADLVENISRFKALFNATSDAVLLIRPDGLILDLNENAAGRRGLGVDGMMGKNLFDFLAPDAAKQRRNAVSRVMEARKLVQYEEERNGKVYSIRLFPVLNEQGEVVQIAGFSRDITEIKQAELEKMNLESRLHQAQKMEAIGRLAGGVAHDFNNMLGVIISSAEFAREQVKTGPVFNCLQGILSAAERSADLTRQLLAFARKQAIVPKVLDLNDVIENMLKILRRLIGENIDLDWRPSRELWPVMMDPSQVDQIMANLCVNARDAIPETGVVIIKTLNRSIGPDYCATHPDWVPGDYVMLEVADDGCGMSKEILASVFEPFFTTKEGKGTGLGLATVYGIVRQNNGFIHVYSEPGRGTAFHLYLPRHQAAPGDAAGPAQSRPPDRGNETVLLVEDEAMFLEVVTRRLEKIGYKVLAAGGPGEAIRLARENAGVIDLLITDVVMPEMSGRDLARRITAMHPETQCLFMSGYTADVIAHQGVLEEGIQFIHKPFTIKDLAAKIRETLGK